jgi:hypothetical protein
MTLLMIRSPLFQALEKSIGTGSLIGAPILGCEAQSKLYRNRGIGEVLARENDLELSRAEPGSVYWGLAKTTNSAISEGGICRGFVLSR